MIDLGELRAQFPNLTNIAPLASGGQKEVCRAELAGKAVALKLILPISGAEERTRREIEASRQLSSSYIPQVFDTGERILCGRQRHYIIEELVQGQTYRAMLMQQPVRDFAEVLELTKVLVSAAADFERIKLVHRDIKPENIIVDQNGKIWILDFGIARHLNLSSLTPSGGFGIGTIGYAPPEQYRNLKPEIDPLFSGVAPTTVNWPDKSAFRHYLACLDGQVAQAHKNSFDETVTEHRTLLDNAEATLKRFRSKGVLGGDREFTQILDINRSALTILTQARGAQLRRVW